MTVAELLDIMTVSCVRTMPKISLLDLDSEARGEETEVKLTAKGFSYTPMISSYRAFAHRHVNSVHFYGGKLMITMYGVEE